MFVAEPVVEGETGKTADKQRAGVDKMGNEVERLRHVSLFFGQHSGYTRYVVRNRG